MTTDVSLDATDRPQVCAAGGSDTWLAGEDRGRAFLDLAALGTNRPRAYVITTARILLYHFGFGAIVVAWVILGHHRYFPLMATLVLEFGSIIAAGVAVVQSVARTHRRPWLSLVSPSLTIDWRRLAIGAAVQAVLSLLLLVFVHFIAGEPWPLASVAKYPLIALAIALTPLQAASEELLIRGYLTQALGRLFRGRTKIVIAVGATFAVLHLNAYGPLTMPYMFVVSVILSLVALRDGRLELAIGAHIAENWLSVGGIDAIVFDVPAAQIAWPHLPELAVQGILFYALTTWLVRWSDRKRCETQTASVTEEPAANRGSRPTCEAGAAGPSPKDAT